MTQAGPRARRSTLKRAEGECQTALSCNAPVLLWLGGGCEDLMATRIFTGPLHPIHRPICRPQQVFSCGRRPEKRHRADAECHSRCRRFSGPAQILAEPLEEGLRHRAAGVREEDRELVASKPRRHVDPSNRALKSRGDCYQERISHSVAMAIVDLLEIVDVDVHHRQRDREPASSFDLVCCGFPEGASV